MAQLADLGRQFLFMPWSDGDNRVALTKDFLFDNEGECATARSDFT